MKLYIGVARNGIWYENELDLKEFEFNGNFEDLQSYLNHYTALEQYGLVIKDMGNNPFKVTESYQYRIYRDDSFKHLLFKSFVELQVVDYEIRVFKVLEVDDFETTNQLMEVLEALETVYTAVLMQTELTVEEHQEHLERMQEG